MSGPSVVSVPRSTILASANRTSDAASITTLAAIAGLSLTFTPDDRPFGVRLVLPQVLKDATGAVTTAWITDAAVGVGVGNQTLTLAANGTGTYGIDLEPGFIAASGLLAVPAGTSLTLKAALQCVSGGAVVKSTNGGAHPLFYAYTATT